MKLMGFGTYGYCIVLIYLSVSQLIKAGNNFVIFMIYSLFLRQITLLTFNLNRDKVKN